MYIVTQKCARYKSGEVKGKEGVPRLIQAVKVRLRWFSRDATVALGKIVIQRPKRRYQALAQSLKEEDAAFV